VTRRSVFAIVTAGALGACLAAYPVAREDGSHGAAACVREDSPARAHGTLTRKATAAADSFIRDATGAVHYVRMTP
jgi:hypothetical protein